MQQQFQAPRLLESLTPGSLVSKRYEIVSVVDSGTFFTCFKALDRVEQSQVVHVNVLHTQTLSKELFLASSADIRKLPLFSHPGIAEVLEMNLTQEGLFFIVSKTKDATSISRKLQHKSYLDKSTFTTTPRPLPLKSSIEILLQIAEALDEAHEKGFFHWNLKPSNILLPDKPFIINMGLSQFLHRLATEEQSTKVIGTPEYLSPEQILRKDLDARVDVYALGILGYELVVASPPFWGDPQRVLTMQVSEALPEFSDASAGIPKWYEAVIRAATEKDAENRFYSMAEFSAALLEYCERFGIEVGSPTPKEDFTYMGDPSETQHSSGTRPRVQSSLSLESSVLDSSAQSKFQGIETSFVEEKPSPTKQRTVYERLPAMPFKLKNAKEC